MSTAHPQPAILIPPPLHAVHLEFALAPGANRTDVLAALRSLTIGDTRIDGVAAVAGLGTSLVELLGLAVPGLRTFPALAGAGIDVPSTPQALWIWLRGEDRGELHHRARALHKALAPAFASAAATDTFFFNGGRDLTGYEDGTENPQGEDATAAAIVADTALAPPGSSFVAVQKWLHDLDGFSAMDKQARDFTFGRESDSNEEIDDAPESAHVKRTAQEDFDPPAFVVRRSMPWAADGRAGLVFVAFGATLDNYERLLRRMAGLDDGVIDGLFGFTRPLTGAYYWCPPLVAGRLAIPGLG